MEDRELFVGEDTQQCIEQCTHWKRERSFTRVSFDISNLSNL
jgi:hypothetical protein